VACRLCVYIGQYALNWLNLADHAVNTLLLGDADETVSARVARARKAGHIWAFYACSTLSFTVKVITLGHINRDHCVHALDTSRPNTGEIWNWSTCSINPTPVSEVQVIDNGTSEP
jgi:hypothetical protein